MLGAAPQRPALIPPARLASMRRPAVGSAPGLPRALPACARVDDVKEIRRSTPPHPHETGGIAAISFTWSTPRGSGVRGMRRGGATRAWQTGGAPPACPQKAAITAGAPGRGIMER